jgi:hypothetical protein
MLGVWQTGEAARRVSASNPEWLAEYHRVLPDFRPADVSGSCFAVQDYHVHRDFGGDAALARLRERLTRKGLRLMLDFVPNHVAPDHVWVQSHPDYFIEGTEDRLAAAPGNWTRVDVAGTPRILAYGRDPYFAGWPDTLQLDYGNRALQDALVGELRRIARQCDGVRCDMAMLVLPDVFHRTWGITTEPFWARATAAVRAQVPGFVFMAEVYWDLEWALQHEGFDFTYDKRLYDRLRDGNARLVREHFHAGLDYQNKLARFLENHDEPRTSVTFTPEIHRAAAVITFLSPALRFFHQGQFEGRRKRISPHLVRGPDEPIHENLKQFYDKLIAVLRRPVIRDGQWQLLECKSAWDGNWTSDCFLASFWQGVDDERLLVVVNYAGNQSQCYIPIPVPNLREQRWRLEDLLGDLRYDRDGNELESRGLYLDVGPWQAHVFSLTKKEQ